MDFYVFLNTNGTLLTLLGTLAAITGLVFTIQSSRVSKKVIGAIITFSIVFIGVITFIAWDIWNTPQNIYERAIHGNPIVNDPLTAQDTNSWTEQSNSAFSCSFNGGAYHASSSQSSTVALCLAHATNFSNFAFQAQMIILNGDAGGLAFCADERHFYRFTVHSNGFYELFVSESSQGKRSQTLTQGQTTIDPYQSNLLTVIVSDSRIYLYINRQFLTEVNDSTFSFGEIGVFGYDIVNPTDVAFRNAQVWAL